MVIQQFDVLLGVTFVPNSSQKIFQFAAALSIKHTAHLYPLFYLSPLPIFVQFVFLPISSVFFELVLM